MKAFLIDPRERKITTVEYHGDYKEIYTFIGNECKEFANIVMNHKRDMMYIDAGARREGDKRYNMAKDSFQHKRYRGLLLGRALVLGSDDFGESTEPVMTIEHLQQEIVWRR